MIRRLAEKWGVEPQAVAVQMAEIGVPISPEIYEEMEATERVLLANACRAIRSELLLDLIKLLNKDEDTMLDVLDQAGQSDVADGLEEMMILEDAVDDVIERIAPRRTG